MKLLVVTVILCSVWGVFGDCGDHDLECLSNKEEFKRFDEQLKQNMLQEVQKRLTANGPLPEAAPLSEAERARARRSVKRQQELMASKQRWSNSRIRTLVQEATNRKSPKQTHTCNQAGGGGRVRGGIFKITPP